MFYLNFFFYVSSEETKIRKKNKQTKKLKIYKEYAYVYPHIYIYKTHGSDHILL